MKKTSSSLETNMWATLSEFEKELLIKYGEVRDFRRFFRTTRRPELITKIENMVFKILESIEKGEAPKFEDFHLSTWKNCQFDDERIKVKDRLESKYTCVDFGKANSRVNFSVTLYLLSKVYKLLIGGQTKTRREIYYEDVDIFGSQCRVDYCMRSICLILEAPTWELGVFATSKGIMAGPVTLTLSDGEEIDFDLPGGGIIPQNVLEVERITSSAKWILIVEKDSAFQKLLDEDGLTRLGPCIFLTGKGYPDVNTRLMVTSLWERLKIPILCLVDADPHGIEIMCVYRFGALAMSPYSEFLACPAIRWVGVHPSDIKRLGITSLDLTLDDEKKIEHLLKRPYICENEGMKNQFLLNEKIKAEIEGISRFSPAYLTDGYLPNKIACKEYI